MPDQSSAANEHAILQEITAPLATLPDDPVPIVADVDFPLALRGYDRLAVDAYVRNTSQLVAELQATRSPDAAIRRALERVGEQISGILQRAHETAEQITAQSRSEAEDRLEAARQEAAQIVAKAQNRLKELDADTDRIWAERHRIVEDARELASQLLALADSAADRFPPAEEQALDEQSGIAEDAEIAEDAWIAEDAGMGGDRGMAKDPGAADAPAMPGPFGAPGESTAHDEPAAPEEAEPLGDRSAEPPRDRDGGSDGDSTAVMRRVGPGDNAVSG